MAPAKPEGANTQLVRAMFLAGESMNVNNFAAFYGEKARYQFSNFPVAIGPQGIIDASDGFIPLWDKDVTLGWGFQER